MRLPPPPLAALLPAVAWLVAAPASAQDFEHGSFVPSPGGISGDYTRIVAGDLNGSFSPEVAVIKGTTLIVYHDPDSERASVVVAEDAVDVAYSRNASGDVPGLLYVTSEGLKRVLFDAGENEYVVDLVDDAPHWQTATRIRSTPVGLVTAQGKGLIGYSPYEQEFFYALQSGTSFTTPTTLFSFTLSAEDVVLLDYDADGLQDLGILHGNGIHVREQDGAFLLSRNAYTPGDSIARVVRAGWSESLAWITRLPGGTSALLVFNPGFGGSGYQGPIALDTTVYDSLASADVAIAGDPDGLGDLVLASSSSTLLRVHQAAASGTWFSGTATQTIEMGLELSSPDPSTGPVLSTNLFNDWTGDDVPVPGFALPLAGYDGLRMMPPMSHRNPLTFPDFDLVLHTSAKARYGCPDSDPADRSKWRIEIGQGWGAIDATLVEMVVRRSVEDDDDPPPSAYHSQTFELGSTALADFVAYFDGAETPSDPEQANLVSYFVKIRPKKPGQVWRWSILGMTTDCDSAQWIEGLPGASDAGVTIDFDLCTSDGDHDGCTPALGPGGSRYIPVGVPLSLMPGSPGVLPGGGPQ